MEHTTKDLKAIVQESKKGGLFHPQGDRIRLVAALVAVAAIVLCVLQIAGVAIAASVLVVALTLWVLARFIGRRLGDGVEATVARHFQDPPLPPLHELITDTRFTLPEHSEKAELVRLYLVDRIEDEQRRHRSMGRVTSGVLTASLVVVLAVAATRYQLAARGGDERRQLILTGAALLPESPSHPLSARDRASDVAGTVTKVPALLDAKKSVEALPVPGTRPFKDLQLGLQANDSHTVESARREMNQTLESAKTSIDGLLEQGIDDLGDGRSATQLKDWIEQFKHAVNQIHPGDKQSLEKLERQGRELARAANDFLTALLKFLQALLDFLTSLFAQLGINNVGDEGAGSAGQGSAAGSQGSSNAPEGARKGAKALSQALNGGTMQQADVDEFTNFLTDRFTKTHPIVIAANLLPEDGKTQPAIGSVPRSPTVPATRSPRPISTGVADQTGGAQSKEKTPGGNGAKGIKPIN